MLTSLRGLEKTEIYPCPQPCELYEEVDMLMGATDVPRLQNQTGQYLQTLTLSTEDLMRA